MVVVSIVLGLAGLVGIEWMLSIRDAGPYSFDGVPKGGLIAYSALEGVRLVRSEGGTSWLVRAVTRNPVDDSSPTWSPDGRRIAFDRIDYERDRTAIVVVDLTTEAETEIAHSDGAFVSEPAWQPTGIEGAWPSRLHRVVGSS